MRTKILLIISLGFVSATYALAGPKEVAPNSPPPAINSIFFLTLHSWSLGLGGKTDFINTVQVDRQGSKNSFDPELTLLGGLNFMTPWFLPFVEAGSTLPGEGRDPHITRFTWFANCGLQKRFNLGNPNALGLKTGVGMSMTTISSTGGTQTLQNGNQSDSFPMPSGTAITRNVIAVFGLNYDLLANWRVAADYHLFNAFNDRNRAWSSLFSLSYLFDFKQPPVTDLPTPELKE